MDIKDAMRFILDMQAKHAAAIQRHDEAMAKLTGKGHKGE
jgi:hypothetical protein